MKALGAWLGQAAERRRGRDDRGAMLVIALIIITTVALVTGAILAHGWVNLRSTVVLRGVAGTSYAADAAAKVAVNDLRLGSTSPDWVTPGFNGLWSTSAGWVYTANDDGAGCFGAVGMLPQNNLELDNVYPKTGDQTAATSARVECTPVDGTGILGSNGGVVINDPDATDPYAQALTTLGTAADPHNGAYFKVLGAGNTNAAPIGGGIISKTTVAVDNGDLTTLGSVWANGSCSLGTGRVVSPDKECPKSGGVDAPAVPTSPLSTVPTFRNPAGVTNCHFPAGYYNNGASLSTVVNACTVAYFDDTSGPYYFDFADGKPWTITTKVIGGVPTGTDTIPGACQSPIKYPSTAGVQFVFGGASTMFVDNTGQVEICGPSNGGDAPLTLFQQQTGTDPVVTQVPAEASGKVTTVASSNPNKTSAFVVDPDQTGLPSPKDLTAAVQTSGDSLGAKWTAPNAKYGGELDLSSFAGMNNIPANAAITSATVHVAYSVAPPASVTPVIGVSGVAGTSAITAGDADVTTQLQSLLASSGFNSTDRPTIQFKIPTGTSAAGNTLTVDRVTLAVTWQSAVLQPATNTTFISTKTNSSAKFVVQGATYAPQGYLDMEPGNDVGALVAFRWGLVAQAVNFTAQPQQLFGYPLVSIPKAGHGLGTRVTVADLKVYVCVSSATCSSGGTLGLTVRVLITDPPYNTNGTWQNVPQPGRRQMKIISWAEQR